MQIGSFNSQQGLIIGYNAIKSFAQKLAQRDFHILIEGESGVGKYLFAKYLHAHSQRCNKIFYPISCTNLQPTLFDTIIFGYKKGCFTGAQNDKGGILEDANGGIIFWDEIADLTLELQAKILPIIELARYRRVGDSIERETDIRFIFATNKNLADMTAHNLFRLDLYYRISAHKLFIPPLRSDKNNIEIIANFYWKIIAQDPVLPSLSRHELDLLRSYDFPGNTRELTHILEELFSLVTINGNNNRTEYLKAILNNGLHSIKANNGKYSDTEKTFKLICEKGISFWDAVYFPYKKGKIAKEQVIEIIEKGLRLSNYSWKNLIHIFNLQPSEYKKFLNAMKNLGIKLSQFKVLNCISLLKNSDLHSQQPLNQSNS